MNNTKTLAIVTVLMAATLVVGTFATMATIQSAYAYAKKPPGQDDNKKTRDNGSGNGNGNTVTIEECKNRGSASGFDTALDQECENLICTHPGENATCTQEGAAAGPTTTTLLVKKVCFQADSTPCPSEPRFTFPITVTDDNPQPSTFSLANGDSQLVTLSPGTYTVAEGHPTFFTVTFSGDCNANGDGTIAAGQHQICTITNTESQNPIPLIILTK
jgi:hypothetical protein